MAFGPEVFRFFQLFPWSVVVLPSSPFSMCSLFCCVSKAKMFFVFAQEYCSVRQSSRLVRSCGAYGDDDTQQHNHTNNRNSIQQQLLLILQQPTAAATLVAVSLQMSTVWGSDASHLSGLSRPGLVIETCVCVPVVVV